MTAAGGRALAVTGSRRGTLSLEAVVGVTDAGVVVGETVGLLGTLRGGAADPGGLRFVGAALVSADVGDGGDGRLETAPVRGAGAAVGAADVSAGNPRRVESPAGRAVQVELAATVVSVVRVARLSSRLLLHAVSATKAISVTEARRKGRDEAGRGIGAKTITGRARPKPAR